MKMKQDIQKKREAEYLKLRNEKFGVWTKLGRMSWLWSVKTNTKAKSEQASLNYMTTVKTIARNIEIRDAQWQAEVGDRLTYLVHRETDSTAS